MNSKTKQEISGVENSNVNVAGGNMIINQGLSYSEVKDLCHQVLTTEITNSYEIARVKLLSDIKDYYEKLISKIKVKENSEILEKLQKPKLQFYLHDSIKEFASTDEELTKEELIDLLISRLEVKENTIDQFLIDQATNVLPTLSLPQLYFLGALLYRQIKSKGYLFIVEQHLKTQAKVYQYIDKITKLDIEYLKLQKCVKSFDGIALAATITQMLKNHYPLFFTHPITKHQYSQFFDQNPLSVSASIPWGQQDNQGLFNPAFDTKESFLDYYKKVNVQIDPEYIEKFISIFPPLNEQEIKIKMKELNPLWEKAFEVMDRDYIKKIELSPLGTFIALRFIDKRLNDSTLELKEFYK